MTTNTRPWTKYTDARPTMAGPYEWRMPSVVLKDALVIVAAHMRMRGAGYEDVLSPVFDYWDGYRVHVPLSLEWRPTDAHASLARHDIEVIGIEGLQHCPCIYCGRVPKLTGVQYASGGGFVVGGAPHRLNTWRLECCAWGKTPSLDDPREIESVRLAAFARAAEAHQEAPAPSGAPA